MLLSDPGAAFASIAANLRPGGPLLFICLRAVAERLKAALAPHDRAGCVTLGGATWLVGAVRTG